MKKFVVLSLVAVASLGLGACSKSAENTAEANEAAVADLNATANEAIEDVNAAEAVNEADAALDNAADTAATNAM
jgi:hypothetical protein